MAWVPSAACAVEVQDKERDLLNDQEWDWWQGADSCSWRPPHFLASADAMDTTADSELSLPLLQEGAEVADRPLAVKRKFNEREDFSVMQCDTYSVEHNCTFMGIASPTEGFPVDGAESTQHAHVVYAPGYSLPFECMTYQLMHGKRAARSLGCYATAEEAALQSSQWRRQHAQQVR